MVCSCIGHHWCQLVLNLAAIFYRAVYLGIAHLRDRRGEHLLVLTGQDGLLVH